MSENKNAFKVGIVIPSLGKNLSSLEASLKSVELQTYPVSAIVVIPKGNLNLEAWLYERKIHFIHDNNEATVSGAINCGVEYLCKAKYDIFAFLGDDDLLLPTAVSSLIKVLTSNTNAVAAFGSCWYFNSEGRVVFNNDSKLKLMKFMHFMPNLLPHPGALMYVQDWKDLKGFDSTLKFAPDLDYWFRLKKKGKFIRTRTPVALFGWNSEGLTASRRSESIAEAKLVRKRYVKGISRLTNFLFEPLFLQLGEYYLQKNTTKR